MIYRHIIVKFGLHTYASGMPDIAKVLKAHLALIAADDIGHRFDLLCKVHLPIVAGGGTEEREGGEEKLECQ